MKSLALMAALSFASAFGDQAEGVITLNITTNSGGNVSPGRIIVRALGKNVVADSTSVKDIASKKLPYGTYEITFESQGWMRTTRQVHLDRPEVFVTLTIEPEAMIVEVPYEPVAVSVRARPATSCRGDGFIWAKLVGIFSDDVKVAKLSPHGFALFEPVQIGKYVLVVIDGDEIRASLVVNASKAVTDVEASLATCK